MHTLKIAVCKPDPGTEQSDLFHGLRQVLSSRLHLLPAFRMRVLEVPYGLHHPVWVEDPNFDIEDHLRRRTVPSPGGALELDHVIADIAGRPLRRDRPLWEIWLVDGMADGTVVCVAKIHHAVADGVASAEMMANVMGSMSREGDPPRAEGWAPGPLPGAPRMLVDAFRSRRRQFRHLPPLLAQTARGGLDVARYLRAGDTSLSHPFQTPSTVFNRKLVAARRFARASLPLGRVKDIKTRLDVRLNDVVLAIVGGALRLFFKQRGELLDRALVATVPMSVATPRKTRRLIGNRLANLFTCLADDIVDPIARVRAIHTMTDDAKEVQRRLGMETMLAWSEFMPPRTYQWLVRAYSASGITDRIRPPANLIVSNVRGPAQPLRLAGATLENIYSVGPILDGIGLNMTAWSYGEHLSLSALCDAASVTDLHALVEMLPESLDELERAVARKI